MALKAPTDFIIGEPVSWDAWRKTGPVTEGEGEEAPYDAEASPCQAAMMRPMARISPVVVEAILFIT